LKAYKARQSMGLQLTWTVAGRRVRVRSMSSLEAQHYSDHTEA